MNETQTNPDPNPNPERAPADGDFGEHPRPEVGSKAQSSRDAPQAEPPSDIPTSTPVIEPAPAQSAADVPKAEPPPAPTVDQSAIGNRQSEIENVPMARLQ